MMCVSVLYAGFAGDDEACLLSDGVCLWWVGFASDDVHVV